MGDESDDPTSIIKPLQKRFANFAGTRSCDLPVESRTQVGGWPRPPLQTQAAGGLRHVTSLAIYEFAPYLVTAPAALVLFYRYLIEFRLLTVCYNIEVQRETLVWEEKV